MVGPAQAKAMAASEIVNRATLPEGALVRTRHGWRIVNALWQYAEAIPGYQRP
jgi:hypothetical protein